MRTMGQPNPQRFMSAIRFQFVSCRGDTAVRMRYFAQSRALDLSTGPNQTVIPQ